MSISDITPAPVLQWLQNSLSGAGLTVGNPSSSTSGEFQPGSDSISPFQQALQMLTNQTAPPTDSPSSLSTNGAQGTHHHHHHHGGGEGNNQGTEAFINQLAQSIITDLQQTDGTDTAPDPSSSSASSISGMSSIDGLESAIANSLLTQYQQATNSSPTPSSTNSSTPVNAIA